MTKNRLRQFPYLYLMKNHTWIDNDLAYSVFRVEYSSLVELTNVNSRLVVV